MERRAETLDKILKAKNLRRKELSELPFKRKIEILVQLQKMAKGIKKEDNKRDQYIWKIEGKLLSKTKS